MKEGETAVFPLWAWNEQLQQKSCCAVTGEGLTFDTHSPTSISIDRMTEDFEENEDWAHSTANCRVVCAFANSGVTWKRATISSFFVDYEKVSMVLSNLQSCPQYNNEKKLWKKLKKVARKINWRNENKFQEYIEEEIPEVHPEQLYEITKAANFRCVYGNLPLLPYHKSKAFRLSVEREYTLLPYMVGNILFISEILNSFDNTRRQKLDYGKKYSLSDPFLKSKSKGWSKEIVDETRQRYASGAMISPADATASLKEASDWMIVKKAASEELSDDEESDSDLFSDEDD